MFHSLLNIHSPYRMLIIKMCYQSIGLFLCIILSSSFASLVKFLPTTSFNLPMNFKDGKLACSKETVVFPESLLTSIRLESETSVNEFILPRDGDITIADGTILFGADDADVNCTQSGNVYFLERAIATWSQPDVWSSPRFNDATPDAERVPCFDDIVEFPSNASFTLQLPDQMQTIRGIKMGNNSCNTVLTCYDILNTEGLFVFNNVLTMGLRFDQRTCQSRSGCPCQRSLEINCHSKFCSVPTCVDPIKPEGHCCSICGGVINFNIDESFDIMMFKELVEEIVDSYGSDSLIYHIGRLPKNKVQVVVVEKVEYTGTSAAVVNDIDRQMKQHWIQGAKFVGISGSPLDKSGLGGKIFVSMFFLVILVLSGIYVYYYKFPVLSDMRFLTLHRDTPGVFSRFQSRTDSVVCLTRRDSEATIGRGAGTAFRNPLYDSTRKREELEEIEDSQ